MSQNKTNETVKETIKYLNKVANANFTPTFNDTVIAINNLVTQGFTLDDFKDVIDRKWADWKGTKYEIYVRPSTLFGNKFENYLHESRTPKANRIGKLFDSVERAKQATWRLDKK